MPTIDDVFPQVHKGGTCITDLYDQRINATDSLRVGLDALKAIDINGRDYVFISDDALSAAIKRHERQVERIETTIKELMEEIEAILDQQ